MRETTGETMPSGWGLNGNTFQYAAYVTIPTTAIDRHGGHDWTQ
jgi:hypothetical protein